MSKDLNKCMFIGRLGKDPETKYGQSGSAITNFSIACGDDYTKDGQKHEQTEWINISTFGRLAEICGEYLRKGSKIYIEGKFKTRKYTDSAGVEKYATAVVASEMQMLDSAGSAQQGQAPQQSRPPQQGRPQQQGGYGTPPPQQQPPQPRPASQPQQQRSAPQQGQYGQQPQGQQGTYGQPQNQPQGRAPTDGFDDDLGF